MMASFGGVYIDAWKPDLVTGLKKSKAAGQWWCMPIIPALGRQRQADLCEFKNSLVYKSRKEKDLLSSPRAIV